MREYTQKEENREEIKRKERSEIIHQLQSGRGSRGAVSVLPLPNVAALVCELVLMPTGVFAQLGCPHSSLLPRGARLWARNKGQSQPKEEAVTTWVFKHILLGSPDTMCPEGCSQPWSYFVAQKPSLKSIVVISSNTTFMRFASWSTGILSVANVNIGFGDLEKCWVLTSSYPRKKSKQKRRINDKFRFTPILLHVSSILPDFDLNKSIFGNQWISYWSEKHLHFK